MVNFLLKTIFLKVYLQYQNVTIKGSKQDGLKKSINERL